VKVGVGLSGGVDSAVAASLLIEAGHDVCGYTMTLGRDGEEESVADARAVATRLGIPFVVVDLASAWKAHVLDYIRDTYLAGHTPNPCVRCNARVKFGLFPEAAFVAGCDAFATGHYARVENGCLFRAVDTIKDQSYFLWRVPRMTLERTLFPLGGYTKEEVRALARARGFAVADKGDSQDFCGGDPQRYVAAGDRPGEIVDASGRVLGAHAGFWRYTIGQRKGLGIGGAGEPYYVTGLDAVRNRVIVGRREEAVSYALDADEAAWFVEPPTEPVPCRIRVRSAGKLVDATVVATADGAHATFGGGIAGVAPGQSAVFYALDSDAVLGGGIIR